MADPFFKPSAAGEGRIPPPPPPKSGDSPTAIAEVTIRTMASDLASMGGGGRPQAERVPITVEVSAPPSRPSAPLPTPMLPPRPEPKPEPLQPAVVFGVRPLPEALSAPREPEVPAPAPLRSGSPLLLWLAGGAVGLVILFLIGYYVLPVLFPPPPPVPVKPPVTNLPQATSTTPIGTPVGTPAGGPSFFHASLFVSPVDETLGIKTESGTPFAESLVATVQHAASSSNFIELALQNAAGAYPSWASFMADINFAVIEPSFFGDHFAPDFTAFVYRDKNGVWPGYVLKLAPNESPVLLRAKLLALEPNADALRSLFATAPGSPSGGFTDAQVNGQPIRSLAWTTPGATFTYCWFFNRYLILSTSLDGLRAAVERL